MKRTDFLETLGLEEAGLDRLIRAGYTLLDLITYFTVGPKRKRAPGPSIAAPRRRARPVRDPHRFREGFIRAETIAYDDYVALQRRSRRSRCRQASRLEGKEYVVRRRRR